MAFDTRLTLGHELSLCNLICKFIIDMDMEMQTDKEVVLT